MSAPFQIDVGTGQVTLPGRLPFGPGLSRAEFESFHLRDTGRDDSANASRIGSEYFYHRFDAGKVDENGLFVNVGFHRDFLFSFSFSIDMAGSEWTDSLAIQHRMHRRHMHLMQEWFGPPHQVLSVGPLRWKYRDLGKSRQYKFPWGTGWCAFDPRSNGADAGIRYRMTNASDISRG